MKKKMGENLPLSLHSEYIYWTILKYSPGPG